MNVLRHQPLDLVEFAAHYFSDLLENRDLAKEGPSGMMGIPSEPEEHGHGSEDDYMDEMEGKILTCFSLVCLFQPDTSSKLLHLCIV